MIQITTAKRRICTIYFRLINFCFVTFENFKATFIKAASYLIPSRIRNLISSESSSQAVVKACRSSEGSRFLRIHVSKMLIVKLYSALKFRQEIGGRLHSATPLVYRNALHKPLTAKARIRFPL